MTFKSSPIILAAALALSACSNNGGFGQGGLFGNNNSTGAATTVASDPASPAYFQQAIGDRVLFQVDQSTLTDEARAILDGQAQWLMTNSEYSALIEGHADEQGTREYNIALSGRRANAVMEYLVSRGVAPTRLSTVAFGKERPIALCSEESCYQQNRRAVTVLRAGGLS